ncbi:alcohol dehydrogenase catalytic domain-containing protein, partial [Alicyclobacillus sp.]|uniref:zinc-dependent alcohol dehydrogenase n=1 Tax=Alicyclobacillus sp. TaxID=61169 RepID=UPI0025BCB1D3
MGTGNDWAWSAQEGARTAAGPVAGEPLRPEVPPVMRAAALFGPGDMRVIEKPVPKPGPGEILLRVAACGMCGTDIKIYHGQFAQTPPLDGRFTPGHEVVGTVVALGPGVTEFDIGDHVVCEAHKGCGQCENCLDGEYTACLNYGNVAKGHRATGMTCDGGFAEYAVVHVNQSYKLPADADLDEATIAVTAGTSLYAIDRVGGFLAGKSVAILGPGSVGLVLVQIAKALGASPIVLVGTRESRLALGRSFGADHVVLTGRNESVVEQVLRATGGRGVDFTFECAGGDRSAEEAVAITRRGGKVVLVAFYHHPVTLDLNNAIRQKIDLLTMRGEGRQVLRRAVALQAQGKIQAGPLITHRFPLENIVEAF